MTVLSFTSPFILSGLLLLPAIWWMLRATPPKAERVPFGATIFLQTLLNRKDTPARTPWWLLLLRLGAVAAILIGLAGPILNAPQQQTTDGPVLLIIDDSWPAATTWAEQRAALKTLGNEPGADQRTARWIRTVQTPTLSAPMPLRQALNITEGIVPMAGLPDRDALNKALADIPWDEYNIYWISDGTIGRTQSDRLFLNHLKKAKSLTVYRHTGRGTLAITDAHIDAAGLNVGVHRISPVSTQASLIATARDGRVLASEAIVFTGTERETQIAIHLPLEIRNDIARLSIVGEQSAGATWLMDAGNRRIRAGLVTTAANSLLDSGFYIERALSPYAEVLTGEIGDLATPEVGLLVLDDIGTLRATDEAKLEEWLNAGGVLLRFAGPSTANAQSIRDGKRVPSFPAPLRGTERAFGGALTWAAAQDLAAFDADGPLADIPLSEPIKVRRQVLTRTGAELDHETWAHLEDGTPFITARRTGRGLVIMVHATGTPTWSDFPISGTFPAVMRRITQFAAGTRAQAPDRPLAPYRLLDGYGRLQTPSSSARAYSPQDISNGQAAPGLYGEADTALAANSYVAAVPSLDPLQASLLPPGTQLRGTETKGVRALGPYLLVAALLLFALDSLSLALQHARRATAVIGLGCILSISWPDPGHAQQIDLRPPLPDQLIEATLDVRFAYVMTGDRDLDRLSEGGLYGLSREAHRRTSLEPQLPLGVDIERDDLSVYPLIYWPVTAATPAPSDGALSRLERYMAGGGLLIIDTQDGEAQSLGGETPAQLVLKRILRRMNIPPLEPVTEGHILTRSFYLLNDLPGRNQLGPVWVEAPSALMETTDNVPTIIISGRDWAAAWAVDEGGVPLRPAGLAGERGREMAYRTGVNFAMVALTGNYKGDQIHVKELLERLGTEEGQ